MNKLFISLFLFLSTMGFATENDPFDLSNQPPHKDNFMGELTNMLFTLGLLIVFLFFVSWAFRRFMNTRMNQMNVTSDIKILESRQVSPKLLVHMIQVRNKHIIFAESPTGIDKLTEMPSETRPFQEMMDNKSS